MQTRITRTGADSQKQFIDLPIDVSLFQSPQAATDQVNQELKRLGHAPLCRTLDGIGLQINFMIDDVPYLIAGTSMGELLSSNGGKIETGDTSLIGRISEEIPEETFYGFKLNNNDGKLSLFCSINNKTYPLELTGRAHISDNPKYNMAYITVQATTTANNLEELNDIAAKLSPTAAFLNPLGNWIHRNRSKSMLDNGVSNDERFSTWWKKEEANHDALNAEFKKWWDSQEMQDKRNAHFAEVEKNHATCVVKAPNGELLVDLHTIFGGTNFEEGLKNYQQRVNNISTISGFWKLKSDQVGIFSERPNYLVAGGYEMKAAALENRKVKDVAGNDIAEVFDADAVRALYAQNIRPMSALRRNSAIGVTPTVVAPVEQAANYSSASFKQ